MLKNGIAVQFSSSCVLLETLLFVIKDTAVQTWFSETGYYEVLSENFRKKHAQWLRLHLPNYLNPKIVMTIRCSK